MSYPILYEANEASKTTAFTSLGLGVLGDAISCVVTEERNGEFELEMDYPIDGKRFSDLIVDRIIKCKASEGTDDQLFRIYKIEKPIDGVSTIYAEHISYLLSGAVVMPFSAETAASAVTMIPNYIQWDTDNANFPKFPFSFWTDSEATGEFTMEVPNTVRGILGGSDGSILDVYDGEYEFDNFTVKLHKNRGRDNNVYLRYGKNITDMTATGDISSIYTGILPYWKGTLQRKVWNSSEQRNEVESYDVVTYLTKDGERIEWSDYVGLYAYPYVNVVDFSSEIDSDYANEESGDDVTHYTDEDDIRKKLAEVAADYVKNNKGWEPSDNIKVSFINLWDTEEYKDFEALQKVSLCDTVHVVYPVLDIDVSMKVITTEYNVLLDRYDEIELGEPKSSFVSSTISSTNSNTNKILELDADTRSALQKAQDETVAYVDGKVNVVAKQIGLTEEELTAYIDKVNTNLTGDIQATDAELDKTKEELTTKIATNLGVSKDYAAQILAALVGNNGDSYIYFKRKDTSATAPITDIYIMNKQTNNPDVSGNSYWRWNHNGLYFKDSSGKETVGITNYGALNANIITTGVLNSIVIKGCSLQSADGTMNIDMANNSFVMTTGGTFAINDASGNPKVKLQYGSSGWGLWAETIEVDHFYCNNKSNYGVWINGADQGSEINTVGILFRTSGGAEASKIYGSDDNKCYIFHDAHSSDTTWTIRGHWREDSDRRLKSNIRDISEAEAVELVRALKPSSYNFMSDDKRSYGFIAQDVLDTSIGDSAIIDNHTMPDADDPNESYYSLDYNQFIPLLTKTIQSQDKRITALEERISKLEEALNANT